MNNNNVVTKAANILEYLPKRNRYWAVQIAVLYGNNRSIKARNLISYLNKKYGFDNIWLSGHGGTLNVMMGKFKKRSSSDLKQMLNQVYNITDKSGGHPFWQAKIISVIVVGKTYNDPFNLKVYHGNYTLQIGFYKGPDNQENAKKAVTALRKSGVKAFYYFGKTMSMMTVGLFTEAQAFVTKRAKISPSKSWIQAYSPAVRQLQKRFPYNLDNGKTLKQSINGKSVGTQRSFLVQTP